MSSRQPSNRRPGAVTKAPSSASSGKNPLLKRVESIVDSAKDKWNSLDDTQKRNVKIGAGGVLALLVLKRLLFGKKGKGKKEDLHATGTTDASSVSLGASRDLRGSLTSTPQKGLGTPAYRGTKEVPLIERLTPIKGDFDGGDFSLVSYNTLADIFATSKRHPYVFNRYLAWDYRFTLLLGEIKATDADVVTLQEIDPVKFYEWKRGMRTLGYDGIVQERAKTGGTFIACATFWKSDRAKLVVVEHRTRALVTALALTNGRRVVVANCHLEGNPLRPQDRIAQTRNVLAVINKMRSDLDVDCKYSSVIICGDLNCERDSTVYRLLSSGRLEAGATEPIMPGIPVTDKTIAHPFRLQDVYAEAKATPPFTRKVPGLQQTIDYIFASDDLAVRAVARTMTTKERSHAAKHFLPNRHQPSDHVPLGALLG